jgi:hypothetical protein
MTKKAKNQSSLVEPTESELKIFNDLTQGFDDTQMDELSNEYYDLVEKEKTKVSFPRFIIDKYIRSIKPGDTIQYIDENNVTQFLFCLVRHHVEGKDYMLFSLVDKETETLLPEQVYLFFADGYDENGIEYIDIMSDNEEAERICQIIEEEADVKVVEQDIPEEEEKGN